MTAGREGWDVRMQTRVGGPGSAFARNWVSIEDFARTPD